MNMQHDGDRDDANRDPISGAPGAHPVGTGVGALTGGAAAGAVVGAVAGPVGAAIGAAVGAVAGGLAGKGVAEMFDPTQEERYWRENYPSRPYAANHSYDDFAPAYTYGMENFVRTPDRSFEDVEPDLARDWASSRGASTLEWDEARPATRDAWTRLSDKVERAIPGDADGDRR